MASIYRPTLVIGLGGTGKNVLISLKKMIAENYTNGMADFPFLKLLSIDTDNAVPKTDSKIKTIKDSELALNPNTEIFQLKAGFSYVPNFDDFPEIKEWFPSSLESRLIPANLAKGAGQTKPVGRFTLAWNAKAVYDAIFPWMSAPVPIKDTLERGIGNNISEEMNVFICGSICGGTGAGTFLDVAYIVRLIEKELQKNVKIFGMLATSSLFEGVAGGASIKSNCYASLVELDHFMNPINNENINRLFHPAYKMWNPDYSESAMHKGPFDYPFLFDKTNNNERSLDSPLAFSEMAARFINLLIAHEVSDHWISMDNNVVATLENSYKKEVYNKSIQYRSMGTFSILYPKRMITQICAYKLSKEYLNIILDDSYAPQEISNLVNRFLSDIKLNPKAGQIEKAFDSYRTPDFSGSFSDYLEMAKSSKMDDEIEKKSLVDEIRRWKEDIDKDVENFKHLNSVTARDVRESFLAKLNERLSEMVDLKKIKDEANKDPQTNEPRLIRGSVVRAEKFVEQLQLLFMDSSEKYRKLEDNYASEISNYKEELETALDDLSEAAYKVIATKKKLDESKEKALDVCYSLFNSQRMYYICGWIRQLYDSIIIGGAPKYPGLIKELDTYKKDYQKTINLFTDLQKEVNKLIESSNRVDPSPLCEILYDYNQDILGTYNKMMEEKKEDHVFETLSDALKHKDYFGNYYQNVANSTMSLVNIMVLSSAEVYFKDLVNNVNIATRIFDSQKHIDALENGTYLKTAGIFLRLNGGVLSRVNLSFDNSTFFAITIPNEYEGKPCADIKGVLKMLPGKHICPMDANPENFQGDKKCEKYGSCLKRLILKNAPENLSVTPTSEISEINIVHTVAGYPLAAVSSVVNNCKPEYESLKKTYEAENKKKGLDDERLHMFGPVKFDDIEEPSVNPIEVEEIKKFRQDIILAYVAHRLFIKPLSVDFVTEKDRIQKRTDKPSINLGKNLEEAEVLYQSTKVSIQKAVNQFRSETAVIKREIISNPESNKLIGARLREAYWNNDLPSTYLEVMVPLAEELCNVKLEDNEAPTTSID